MRAATQIKHIFEKGEANTLNSNGQHTVNTVRGGCTEGSARDMCSAVVTPTCRSWGPCNGLAAWHWVTRR